MPILLHCIQLYRLCYPRRRLWRNVRPTSQHRAVSPAVVFCNPDCRWRRRVFRFFSHDDIFFHQHFRSLVKDDDDDRALYDLSADSTMTSPLLCDTAYLDVSWVESLCDLFLPVVQSQAVQEHDALTTHLFGYRFYLNNNYQLSLMNPRDTIVLWAELADHSNTIQRSSVGARGYSQLSWPTTVQFIMFWWSTCRGEIL